MKDGDILLFIVCVFGVISALIFLCCKLLKTKEKRKFKCTEAKPCCNGGTELQEIVSKNPNELQSDPSAPEAPGSEKKRKIKKPLPGEDFYAGKTELPHEHHEPSDDDDDDDDRDPIQKLMFGKDDDDPSTGFF